MNTIFEGWTAHDHPQVIKLPVDIPGYGIVWSIKGWNIFILWMTFNKDVLDSLHSHSDYNQEALNKQLP